MVSYRAMTDKEKEEYMLASMEETRKNVEEFNKLSIDVRRELINRNNRRYSFNIRKFNRTLKTND